MSGGQLNDLSNKEDGRVCSFLYRQVKDLGLSPLKIFCSLLYCFAIWVGK